MEVIGCAGTDKLFVFGGRLGVSRIKYVSPKGRWLAREGYAQLNMIEVFEQDGHVLIGSDPPFGHQRDAVIDQQARNRRRRRRITKWKRERCGHPRKKLNDVLGPTKDHTEANLGVKTILHRSRQFPEVVRWREKPKPRLIILEGPHDRRGAEGVDS